MNGELVEALLEKANRSNSPGSVTAIVDRLTCNDSDGLQCVVYVCENERVERIEAYLIGRPAETGQSIDREVVEAAVERQAVNAYPSESRMDDLVAASPIPIWPQDLRPHSSLPAAFL